MPTTDLKNPYVGPTPFGPKDRLHGRARETRELFYRLTAQRIVWLHSPSGAGKSSLIHADGGLITRLEKGGFTCWQTIEVGNDPGVQKGNRYTLSAIGSLAKNGAQSPDPDLEAPSLARYVEDRIQASNSPEAGIVLIFDQFEQVLTADPVDIQQKTDFFRDLGELLRNPQIWALFAIREDYLARMDAYARWLPTQLHNRFQLDLLNKSAASKAVIEPAKSKSCKFSEDGFERLFNDLALTKEQLPDGKPAGRIGLYIEPMILQVVCFRLWEEMCEGWERNPEDDRVIGLSEVEAHAKPNQALQPYYDLSVGRAAKGDERLERQIRSWFGEKLITVRGFRSQVRAGEDDCPDTEVLQDLISRHLIREDDRAGSKWYELVHDLLIPAVIGGNEQWFEEHLHWVQMRADLWRKQDRDKRRTLLLQDTELEMALDWAGRDDVTPTDDEQEFLDESEAQQEILDRDRKKQRLIRRISAVLAVAVVALVAAVWFAMNKKHQAEEQSRLAQSRLLVNVARSEIDNEDYVCAAEHALEGMRLARTNQQAANTLQDALRYSLPFQFEEVSRVTSVDMSRQRDRLVTASRSEVRLWELSATDERPLGNWSDDPEQQAEEGDPRRTWTTTARCIITAVALSADGARLAVGSRDGTVQIVEVDDEATTQFDCQEASDESLRITDLEFSPTGLLASTSRDGTVTVRQPDKQIAWDKRISDSALFAVSFAPSGEQLVIGSQDGFIAILSAERGRQSGELMNDRDGKEVSDVAFGQDKVATVSRSAPGLHVWDANTREQLWPEGDKSMFAVTISPDSTLVASAGNDGVIHVRDLAGQEVLWTLDNKEEPTDIAFWLAGAGNVGPLVLADAEGFTRLYHLDRKRLEQQADLYLNQAETGNCTLLP
jgi:conflict system STAND superfamily ATPase/WD40 domain-containing protein